MMRLPWYRCYVLSYSSHTRFTIYVFHPTLLGSFGTRPPLHKLLGEMHNGDF